VSFDSVNLLIINLYMPYEDGNNHIDKFVSGLTIVEEVISGHSDCRVVLAGDFNVDFCRDWSHTAILNSFCEDGALIPTTDRHAVSYIDYTYTCNMARFSCLDHFILSGTLFDESIMNASVLHDVVYLSDHDPICCTSGLTLCYWLAQIGFIFHDFPGLRPELVNLVIMLQYYHKLCKLLNHLLMHCYVQIGVVKILTIIVK